MQAKKKKPTTTKKTITIIFLVSPKSKTHSDLQKKTSLRTLKKVIVLSCRDSRNLIPITEELTRIGERLSIYRIALSELSSKSASKSQLPSKSEEALETEDKKDNTSDCNILETIRLCFEEYISFRASQGSPHADQKATKATLKFCFDRLQYICSGGLLAPFPSFKS